MSEEETIERLKKELKDRMNKVPMRIVNGGVMQTRMWVERRDLAARILKKRGGPNARDLLTAINSLE
jgi:hypothetical protein